MGEQIDRRVSSHSHGLAFGGIPYIKRIDFQRLLDWHESDVHNYVAQCKISQKQKYQATSPARLLQPLPIPERIWEDIAMDFITGLAKSRGYDSIMVVADRRSKYGHFLLIKHPYSARTVAVIFVKEIVRLHVVPTSI